MPLPTTETEAENAENFAKIGPRKMSLSLQNANPEEINFFINLLSDQNRIGLDYYLLALLSTLTIILGLLFNSAFIAFGAALLAPFALPFIAIALCAAKPSLRSALAAFLHLLISAGLYYLGGHFAAVLVRAGSGSLPLSFLLENTWLHWIAAVTAAALTGFFTIRQYEGRRLSSAFLSALVLLPFALLGWRHQASGFITQDFIFIAIRILLALFAMCMTFWFSHLPPRKAKGWIIFSTLTGSLILLFVLAILHTNGIKPPQTLVTQTPVTATLGSMRPTQPVFTIVPSNTPTVPPTLTATPLPTFTPTPAPLKALVIAFNGLNLRAEADINSAFVSFLPYNTEVTLLNETVSQNGVEWVKIQLADGTIAWTLGEFLQKAGH
ncbi:MAG: SH3 domain-containing protein [Anaerolineaceae bacterium]|nr:SH3 domain-containing protein [Anaerolineaceae bacterium]